VPWRKSCISPRFASLGTLLGIRRGVIIGMSSLRDRDCFQSIPFLTTSGPRSQARQRRERLLNQKTNSTITAIGQLDGGRFDHKRILEPSGGTEEDLERCPEQVKERIFEVRQLHKEALAEAPDMSEVEAEKLITKTDPADYGGHKDPSPWRSGGTGRVLARGDTVDLEPDLINFPDPGTKPQMAGKISPDVGHYFARPSTMLRPETEELKKEYEAQAAYSDPRLRQKPILRRLLCRMWVAGMLAFTAIHSGSACMFAVVKALERGPDGALICTEQRLIFDARKLNLLFHPPPKMQVTGSGQLSFINLSPQEMRGRRARWFGADVKCFYYHLAVCEELLRFFVIDSVTSAELCAWLLEDYGITVSPPSPSHRFVSIRVIIMGWAWGCWVANNVLETILSSSVPRMPAKQRLLHGVVIPFFSGKDQAIVHYQYIDDFGGVIVIWLPAGLSDVEVEAYVERILDGLLTECRVALAKWGLHMHKVQKGLRLEALGIVAMEDSRGSVIIKPTAKKYRMLEAGTRRIARIGRCSPKSLERLAGHWVGVMLINRLALSIFHSTYDFLKRHKDSTIPMILWSSVRGELAAAAALLPLMRAVLTVPFLLGCYCSDASHSWGATLYTTATYQEVRKESRWAEAKGWHV
jgi:hypothetical protein